MRQLLASFLLGSVLCAATGYAADVHVGTHGAFANDNRDDRAKIQDAIQACQPGDRLLFRPGIYDLWNQGTPLALSLSGKSQLEIDGRGCTLRLHGFDIVNPGSYANVFFGEGCDQIWIHDLVIDMVREPFSVAQVAPTSAGTGTVRLRFDPAFPVVDQTIIEAMMSYDAQGKPDGSSCDVYFQNPLQGNLVGSQTLEFTMNLASSPPIGQRVVVRHKVYGANAFQFHKSSALTLQDVTVYTVAGMAIVCASCRDVSIQGCSVKVPSGSPRLMSTTADACHFVACEGAIVIQGSQFQRMGDDAVNIHGYFHEVVEASPGTTRVHIQSKANQWHLPYRSGDVVGFYDATSLALVGTASVVAPPTTFPGSTTEHELQVSTIPPLPPKAIVSNETLVPTALIEGCSVEHHRGRGFVLQTRGVRVLDNVLLGSTGPAIAVRCDINFWWEATGGKNVELLRNVIDGANFGAARSHAAIVVEALTSGSTPAPAGAHRDLQIFDQQISNTPRSAIYLGSSFRTEIVGNTMSQVSTSPTSSAHGYAIVLASDDLVLVAGNSLTNSGLGVLDPSSTRVTLRSNSGF